MPAKTEEILAQLVACRSDVGNGKDEKAMIDFIRSWFQSRPAWKLTEQKVTGQRVNLIAQTSENPRIVVIGHLDTVPVTQTSQLVARQEGNKLFGRGAVDMKAGIAIMLQLANLSLPDCALVFTIDEEYDFFGMKAFLKQYSWQPELVINPEPTDLALLNTARGVAEVEITVRGKSVHAGRRREGVNAISGVTFLVEELEKMLRKSEKEPMLSSVNLAWLAGGVLGSNGEIISRANMVPDIARALVEIRLGSSQSKPRLSRLLKSIATMGGLSIEKMDWKFVFQPMMGDKKRLQNFVNQVKEESVVKWIQPDKTGFYEVQLLAEKWNCPVVAFGPGPSEKAHTEDEYVDLDQLLLAEKIITAYIRKQLE